jgi:hypothetical protein
VGDSFATEVVLLKNLGENEVWGSSLFYFFYQRQKISTTH